VRGALRSQALDFIPEFWLNLCKAWRVIAAAENKQNIFTEADCVLPETASPSGLPREVGKGPVRLSHSMGINFFLYCCPFIVGS